MSAACSARTSAAMAAKARQERELARGNYTAALGYPGQRERREELPRPTSTSNGSRVWVFR